MLRSFRSPFCCIVDNMPLPLEEQMLPLQLSPCSSSLAPQTAVHSLPPPSVRPRVGLPRHVVRPPPITQHGRNKFCGGALRESLSEGIDRGRRTEEGVLNPHPQLLFCLQGAIHGPIRDQEERNQPPTSNKHGRQVALPDVNFLHYTTTTLEAACGFYRTYANTLLLNPSFWYCLAVARQSAHVLPGQRGLRARGRGNERDGGTEEQTNRSQPSGPMGAHSLHRHIAVTSASHVTSGKQVHVGTELLAYRDTHGGKEKQCHLNCKAFIIVSLYDNVM